jgi:O-antigen/teichoic acid export membrane protein
VPGTDPPSPPRTEPEQAEPDTAAATTGRSVLAGGLWHVASYGIPQAYTLVVSIAAARFLGPDGMGRQSFIAFVSLTTAVLLSDSLYVSLMRYIGETRGRGREELLPGLLGWAWRIEGIAAALGAAVLVVPAVLGAEPRGAWALAAVVTATGVMHAVPTAVLIGLQRFRQAAVVGLTTGLVGTCAVTVVLWQGGGITGMFAVEAVVGLLNLAWTGTLARRSFAPITAGAGAGSGPRVEARHLRGSVARFALLSSIGLVFDRVVGTRSEFLFLNHFSSDAQIAFYSIAFSAVMALRLIPRSLGSATAPAFATLYGAGSWDRIRSGYSRSLRLLLLSSLPLTAVGLALGPELIQAVYGESYEGAGGPIQILFLGFPLIALSTVANAVLVGMSHVRRPLIASAVAAAIDVGLALALIPRLHANGAAIANIGGQGSYSLLMLFFASRLASPVDWRPWTTVRAVAASALAGLAAWGAVTVLHGVAGLCAGAAAATAVFVLLGALLRILPADDAGWIEESFGTRLLGSVGWLARLWSERGRLASV